MDPRDFGTDPRNKQRAESAFDAANDSATQAVFDAFDYLGLPEDDQLEGLVIEVNDALAEIFADYK